MVNPVSDSLNRDIDSNGTVLRNCVKCRYFLFGKYCVRLDRPAYGCDDSCKMFKVKI